MRESQESSSRPTRRQAVSAGVLVGSGLVAASCSSPTVDRVVKGAEFVDVSDYGADPTGREDAGPALAAALKVGIERGVRVLAVGQFRISETVVITSSADWSQATLLYTGSGVAVQVGTDQGVIQRESIWLPRVLATRKGKVGWAEVGGSTGVRVVNIYSSSIDVPYVRGFDTGLLVEGSSGNGVAYCDFRIGHLDNNRVNQRLTAQPAGWCNQNTFTGGRWSHNSIEKSSASGTRHIRADNAAPNNNVWINPSLESPGVVEFAIDVDSGSYNFWLCPRFEDNRGRAPVRWGPGAAKNWIVGGFQADSIKETWDADAQANSILASGGHRFSMDSPDGLVLENEMVGGASMTIMRGRFGPLGLDSETSYSVRVAETGFSGKNPHDKADRVRLDVSQGRLFLGTGDFAPRANLVATGDLILLGRGSAAFGVETDNDQDIGEPTDHRPRYVRAGTAMVTGAHPSNARPDPRKAGAGASIFDTSLRKPLWSDGERWVDALGSAL